MAKDMTLLWGSGSPPCWRVMIALEEKQLQGYNQKLLSFEKREHKSKEVMDINPRGQLPAFKHGDRILNESLAACMYLECEFKKQGTKLSPDSSGDQALMLQRMHEVNALNDKIISIAAYNWRVPEAERHESALKRFKENLSTEVKLWEGYLQKSTSGFMVGKEFTLADVIVFPSVAFLFRLGMVPDRYPKLTAYYNKLKDRPSIKATWPPHWLTTPNPDSLKEI